MSDGMGEPEVTEEALLGEVLTSLESKLQGLRVSSRVLEAFLEKHKDTPLYDRWLKIVTKITVLQLLDSFKNVSVSQAREIKRTWKIGQMEPSGIEPTGNESATVKMWNGIYQEEYEAK